MNSRREIIVKSNDADFIAQCFVTICGMADEQLSYCTDFFRLVITRNNEAVAEGHKIKEMAKDLAFDDIGGEFLFVFGSGCRITIARTASAELQISIIFFVGVQIFETRTQTLLSVVPHNKVIAQAH